MSVFQQTKALRLSRELKFSRKEGRERGRQRGWGVGRADGGKEGKILLLCISTQTCTLPESVPLVGYRWDTSNNSKKKTADMALSFTQMIVFIIFIFLFTFAVVAVNGFEHAKYAKQEAAHTWRVSSWKAQRGTMDWKTSWRTAFCCICARQDSMWQEKSWGSCFKNLLTGNVKKQGTIGKGGGCSLLKRLLNVTIFLLAFCLRHKMRMVCWMASWLLKVEWMEARRGSQGWILRCYSGPYAAGETTLSSDVVQ